MVAYGGQRMRSMRVAIAVVLSLTTTPGMLVAQSFDCKRAKTTVEKAVCSNKLLSEADTAMAAKYKQVLSEVPTEMQAEVRADQRSWLQSLDVQCGNSDPSAMLSCVRLAYVEQENALARRVVTMAGVRFLERSIRLLVKDAPDDPWKDTPGMEATPGYGTFHASWPQAVGYPAEEARDWKAWNAAVLTAAQTREGDGTGKPATSWSKDSATGRDAELTATVTSVGRQIVTTEIVDAGMGHGAAHPFQDSENFHWLLKQQRELRVNDVFAAGSPWESVVSARCLASLKEQVRAVKESTNGMDEADFAERLHAVVVEPRNWGIAAGGLTINFPESSVNVPLNPVDSVVVPWTALKPYMAKGFVVPKSASVP